MMTAEQQKVVQVVCRKFIENDNSANNWTKIDEQMSALEWLSDHQVAVEASVKWEEHSHGNPRCDREHPKTECFVPKVIEAVDAILNLYAQTGELPIKNRFVLAYYLALSQTGFIIS